MAAKKPVKKAPKQVAKKPIARTKTKSAGKPLSRIGRAKKRLRAFMSRRPHRSFRHTRRRDYVKPLRLPGYFGFTNYVWKTLWQRKATFLLVVLFYAVLTSILVGIASQDMFSQLVDSLKGQGTEFLFGLWGELSKAGLLLVAGVGGTFSGEPTEAQQIYGALLLLIIWLTTVWLLRAQLVGKKPRLRDGLYNAGAPIISTLLLFVLLLVQMIPGALALIGYTTASATGFLDNGLTAMIFFIVAGLLAMLSIYMMISTFFALVIVTLPGMYPWQALRTAGDLVLGRRFRIILRFFWMVLAVALLWAVIMIPIILVSEWLQNSWKSAGWVPIVPAALTLMSSMTVVFVSAYVYLLYRRIVDDDSTTA